MHTKGMTALKVHVVPWSIPFHSIRHTRRAAQTTNEGSGTADDASQTTPVVEAPLIEPPKKRGRKPGSRTKFKQPPRGVKVALKPSGDE
jgi:hypothetical protein